jgi:PAC2 family
MAIPDELVLDAADLAPLTDPVLLVALSGLFDVAGVATSALDHIADDERSLIVGEIDPDPFYDFTVERPTVEIVDPDDGGTERVVSWPGKVFRFVRSGAGHDLVALSGVEPHLRWTTYMNCVTAVIGLLGVTRVVTLGSTPDVTPHTRMPVVVGSTTDRALAGNLGLAPPTYQGVTGLVGLLHGELERSGFPSVSLRVGVSRYLAMGEHPRAVTSLLLHTENAVGVPMPIDLRDAIARWDDAHCASIFEDEKLRRYVTSKDDHPASGPSADHDTNGELDDDELLWSVERRRTVPRRNRPRRTTMMK